MFVDELERSGGWLFRWRSYVPLILLVPALLVVFTHREYLASSPTWDFVFKLGCLTVALTGVAIRVITLGYAQPGSSGRNTREQIADHLNTSGPYSVCRHPLYLGNIIIALGVLLFTKSLLLAAAGTLAYILFYERITAHEERFLAGKFGDEFHRWAERLPWLLPSLARWQRPTYAFDIMPGVKGEFYGLFAIAAAMYALDTLDRWLIESEFVLVTFWFYFLIGSGVLFIVLRHLRKHTRLLERSRQTDRSVTM